MSFLVAGIVASTVLSGMANKSASDAQDAVDEANKYIDLIDIERQSQENSLTKFNETRELNSIESEQDASFASMGKRKDSAGLQRMQSIAKDDLEKNFERMDADLETSRKMGKLTDSSRRSASKAEAKGRDISLISSTVSNGLMLLGKK